MNAPAKISPESIDFEAGLPKIRQLLRPKEVADYFRLDVDTVYRLVELGELTAENHALKTEGKTAKSRSRQRYIRIHRQSVVNYRKRRQYVP